MFACAALIRRLSNCLLAIPVPDPELQCELIGCAMGLRWLAQSVEQAGEAWSGAV